MENLDYIEIRKEIVAIKNMMQEKQNGVAHMKRDRDLEQRKQQHQFNSIKWDLYRQKCELLEDEYAEFKRTQ